MIQYMLSEISRSAFKKGENLLAKESFLLLITFEIRFSVKNNIRMIKK
jgi:hypothetical protein